MNHRQAGLQKMDVTRNIIRDGEEKWCQILNSEFKFY
jgi:hypothetical protein